MKLATYVLPLALGFGLAAPVLAQEEPAKDQPAKEETAKEAPAKEEAKEPPPANEAEKKEAPAKEEAAKEAPPAGEAAKEPAAKTAGEAAAAPAAGAAAAQAPAKEAAAKPAAAKEAPATKEKELSTTAKSFVPLADSYKAAHDDMMKWIDQINTQTSAAGDKVKKLQTQIQDNESAITQAKLSNDNTKVKDLQKQNKKNWDDLNAAKKSMSEMFSQYAKEASSRVKQYSDASDKALEVVRSQGK